MRQAQEPVRCQHLNIRMSVESKENTVQVTAHGEAESGNDNSKGGRAQRKRVVVSLILH